MVLVNLTFIKSYAKKVGSLEESSTFCSFKVLDDMAKTDIELGCVVRESCSQECSR